MKIGSARFTKGAREAFVEFSSGDSEASKELNDFVHQIIIDRRASETLDRDFILALSSGFSNSAGKVIISGVGLMFSSRNMADRRVMKNLHLLSENGVNSLTQILRLQTDEKETLSDLIKSARDDFYAFLDGKIKASAADDSTFLREFADYVSMRQGKNNTYAVIEEAIEDLRQNEWNDQPQYRDVVADTVIEQSGKMATDQLQRYPLVYNKVVEILEIEKNPDLASLWNKRFSFMKQDAHQEEYTDQSRYDDMMKVKTFIDTISSPIQNVYRSGGFFEWLGVDPTPEPKKEDVLNFDIRAKPKPKNLQTITSLEALFNNWPDSKKISQFTTDMKDKNLTNILVKKTVDKFGMDNGLKVNAPKTFFNPHRDLPIVDAIQRSYEEACSAKERLEKNKLWDDTVERIGGVSRGASLR